MVPCESTLRGTFFIDPNGVIRAILFYPQSTGRNFDEIKRILISLQLSDKLSIATPANWMPGDEVVKKSPYHIESVEKCARDNKDKSGAWFLSLEELTIEDIERALFSKKQKIN